jgi:hypothetical protein
MKNSMQYKNSMKMKKKLTQQLFGFFREKLIIEIVQRKNKLR